MEEKKQTGRPVANEEAREIRFGIRMNKKEHEELKNKAKKNNMSVADYIRYLVEKDK